MVRAVGEPGRVNSEGAAMKTLMCLEHHLAPVADARACVHVRDCGLWLGSFGVRSNSTVIATTKPYASQRPSGAPPG